MESNSKLSSHELNLSSTDDRRQLFGLATINVDPLKKREEFAISLRKKKKQEIIQAKRFKLIHQSQL